ncbi:MAG: HAMP domain-containing protein, partial [Thermoplasmata archaeon]|nr:HAMP domain-containing protein [Thermoplasmata archaeon]
DLEGIITSLDSKLFSENTLSSKLFKHYLLLGLLLFILPPMLDTVLGILGVGWAYYAIIFPLLVAEAVIFFVYWSISRFLTPLEKILVATRHLQAGEMDVDLKVSGYEEIEVLARAVDRLRNSMGIAKRYLGDKGDSHPPKAISGMTRLRSSIPLALGYLLYGVMLVLLSTVFYFPAMDQIFGTLPGGHLLQHLLFVFVALGFSAGLGYMMAVAVGEPLRALASEAERASRGDFTITFHSHEGGEVAELAHHLEDMIRSLETAYKKMEAEM